MARNFSVCFILLALIFGSVLPAFAIGSNERDILNSFLGAVINEAAKSQRSPQNSGGTQRNTPRASTTNPNPEPTSNPNPEPTSFSQKHQDELLEIIGSRIESDLQELGNNILNYNKPAFEVKLTKKERTVPEEYYDDPSDPSTKMMLSPVMYSRVCVKGRTIVLGSAGKDKKFTADFIVTGDPGFPSKSKEATDGPNLTNYDGIYVGASVGIIEKFVGISAQTITEIQQQEISKKQPGVINLNPASFEFVNLAYKDGKIVELHYHTGYGVNSPRAWDFVWKKVEELGLTTTLADYIAANHIAGE